MQAAAAVSASLHPPRLARARATSHLLPRAAAALGHPVAPHPTSGGRSLPPRAVQSTAAALQPPGGFLRQAQSEPSSRLLPYVAVARGRTRGTHSTSSKPSSRTGYGSGSTANGGHGGGSLLEVEGVPRVRPRASSAAPSDSDAGKESRAWLGLSLPREPARRLQHGDGARDSSGRRRPTTGGRSGCHGVVQGGNSAGEKVRGHSSPSKSRQMQAGRDGGGGSHGRRQSAWVVAEAPGKKVDAVSDGCGARIMPHDLLGLGSAKMVVGSSIGNNYAQRRRRSAGRDTETPG